MELSWLYTLLAVLVATLIFLIKNKSGKEKPERAVRAVPEPVATGPGGRRRRHNRHNRIDDEDAIEEIPINESDGDLDSPAAFIDRGKIGTKKLRKLEEKEQRRIQREIQNREREEERQRKEEIDELRRKREEEEEAEEKEREEAERKAEEERLEQERIEYEKMKAEFEIEDEGTDAKTEEEQQNLLTQFIEYIKENKVCYVDALASEFGLRNTDAVERINRLMEQGDLTGVLDDRGKFIYISKDELEKVANWINKKGRVSIDEIRKESNRLIKL